METGSESWKWGLVLILLGVFLLVANQAYVAVTSQEDYPPPDDYMAGDSFDIEHKAGPGAGQPMDIPEQMPDTTASGAETGGSNLPTPPEIQQPPVEHPEIDLNKIKDPGQPD